MLRYLSSYLFQNENEPSDIGDPNSEQLGPSEQNGDVLQNGGNVPPNIPIAKGNDELMEFDGENEEEDDWVLIGEENRKKEEQGVAKQEELEAKKDDPPRLQVQPEVNLVAAPSTEEEDEGEDEDDEDEEDSEGDEVTQDLLWENKLIEHPSMSVYVDLATSISNVASSCVSLSSIAATTSPGESVIVLEQPESDDEDISSSDDSDDDSDMDFVEAIASHEPLPQLQTAEQIHLVDDGDDDSGDSSDEENNLKISTPQKQAVLQNTTPVAPAVQNGRRKKGHYPNSSSHSSQMPRRTHLRNSGTSSSSSNSFINLNGNGAPDAPHDAIKRMKRSGNSSASQNANQPMGQPTCGIVMVNGGAPTVPNGMVKNIKLIDLFPTSKQVARRNFPQKQGTTQKGHFLHEGRRRQDMQNYTKRSSVNNDRRSAQQRRVPQQNAKSGANGGGRGK